jgi:hypothetical protein
LRGLNDEGKGNMRKALLIAVVGAVALLVVGTSLAVAGNENGNKLSCSAAPRMVATTAPAVHGERCDAEQRR